MVFMLTLKNKSSFMSLYGLQNSFGRLKNIQRKTAPGMTGLERNNRGKHESHPNTYSEELASGIHEHIEGCANKSFGRVDDTHKKNGI
jgi:hypothetical protein